VPEYTFTSDTTSVTDRLRRGDKNMSFPWAKQYEAEAIAFTQVDGREAAAAALRLQRVGAGYPVPRNLNYMWNFGVLAGFCLVMQIVTGVVLAMHYAANAPRRLRFGRAHHARRQLGLDDALHARQRRELLLRRDLPPHLPRLLLLFGSYKAPREMIWLLGVVIFLLMMATAFMGYVLPWGQMSFWGAR
jgi:ubiquinol-cytochrome c reductase cytochrome b subunit